MIKGLYLLEPQERQALVKLLELPEDTTEERVPVQVMAWMANQVDCNIPDPDHIERAVLEWVAGKYPLEFEPAITTDNLERLIRRRVATDATEFLIPAWRVALALSVTDESDVNLNKYEMLGQMAARVVPSRSVMQEYGAEFRRLAVKWSEENPRADLEPDLAVLKERPGLAREALRLGLVMSLVDGRLSLEEERLARDIGPEMGVSETEVRDMLSELNQLFWKHQHEAASQKIPSDEMALVAAKQALEESGALEGMLSETQGFILREDKEEEEEPAPSGWARLTSAFSGLNSFFSDKMSSETETKMARLVYLTILKQRAAKVKAQGEFEIDLDDLKVSLTPQSLRSEDRPSDIMPLTIADMADKKPVRTSIKMDLGTP